MRLYAERKTYNEIRVRLSVKSETPDIVNSLTWSGYRFDEFIVSNEEAALVGIPSPTFGDGITFDAPFLTGLNLGGAISTLIELASGPRALGAEMPDSFMHFSGWLLRTTYNQRKLVETDLWSVMPCGSHYHIVRYGEDGEPEPHFEKLGPSPFAMLDEMERFYAEEVAASNAVDPEWDDEEVEELLDFLLSLDVDDEEKGNARWN